MRSYISAYSRLQQLPDIFSTITLMRLMGLTSATAHIYTSRWVKEGTIAPTGPRTATFYNLVKRPDAQTTLQYQAILMEYPAAVLTGESVLHAAGWITQIPSQLQIAIPMRRSYPQLHGVNLVPESKKWFEATEPYILKPEEADFSTIGLRSLTPAMALAHLHARPDAWHPDPDDLDIPREEEVRLDEARQVMGFKKAGRPRVIAM